VLRHPLMPRRRVPHRHSLGLSCCFTNVPRWMRLPLCLTLLASVSVVGLPLFASPTSGDTMIPTGAGYTTTSLTTTQ
jgi:hypothetical protein